ncbi:MULTISPECIES: universal stress protein [unclassified Pseudomonas]|uniref:universal stress protein n=1 Tax=unclassified Pseudomonas TaxID=196821 RepID=UPI00129D41C2|nr:MULTISPECIES: universal stress protein [unclassified Pseudomonas]MDH4652544.1 universal stress protein [Pseudomonas sp. BN606]MRK20875.1 universal stress protein [Pseudomonas sp. JG-B]
MKALMLATDLSNRSDRALRRAARLAHQFNCPWFILHVVDEDQPQLRIELEVEQVRRYLNEQLDLFTELAGRAPEIWVEVGDPAKHITDCTRWADIDLLVVGSHRKNPLRDIFAGTTLERLLRTSHVPILLVNKVAEDDYRMPLLALDCSPASAQAVRAAVELGLLPKTGTKALHAFDPLGGAMMLAASAGAGAIPGDYSADERRRATAALDEFLRREELGAHVDQRLIEEGQPMTALRRVLERDSIDLLVMGTRGLTGMKRILIGSVADAAIRELACDILAVPPIRWPDKDKA